MSNESLFSNITILCINPDSQYIHKQVSSIFPDLRLFTDHSEYDSIQTFFEGSALEFRISSEKHDPEFDLQRKGIRGYVAKIESENPQSKELLMMQAEYINSMIAIVSENLSYSLLNKVIEITDLLGGVIFINSGTFISNKGELILSPSGKSNVDFFSVRRMAEPYE
jgi:hypothetical protein